MDIEDSDWMDDFEMYGQEGAWVSITSDSGDYTDFQLTAAQVRAMFYALAKEDADSTNA